MRYSISPIIEAWLSGVLFLITICLCLFRFLGEEFTPDSLFNIDEKWISIIVIIFCSVAYSIGWAVNHLAEQILDTLFQHPYRKKLEEEENKNFFTIRSYVFQYGSEQLLNDLKYDRQVIRIARSNCFNFFLMGIIIGTFYWVDTISRPAICFFFFFCMSVSILSFFQWKSRYKATYKKIFQAYSALPEGKEQRMGCPDNLDSRKTSIIRIRILRRFGARVYQFYKSNY